MASSEIYNGHVQCLNAFASLLQALQHPSRDLSKHINTLDIQEELAKYNVWAANTGAVNGSDSWALSLDCRLQEASSLRSQVIRLLQSLAKSVQHAAAILHGTRKPFEQVALCDNEPGLESGEESTDPDSPWEISDDEADKNNGNIADQLSSAQPEISPIPDPSSEALRLVNSPSEMTQLYGSIKYTVICLYRMPLRKPAPIDRIKGYNGVDMSLYQHFDVLYIKDKFPVADDRLALRLGKLITRRRQLLEYRRSHNEKLIGPRESDTSPFQPQPPSLPVELEHDVLPGVAEETAGQQRGVGLREGMTVRTKVTILRADQQPQGLGASLTLYPPSIAESRMSAVSSFTENQKLQIPPRPQGPDGQVLDLFECPYCGTLQNIHATASRAWERHVLRDLQPYVCTFESCDMSSHFFSTKDEWSDHELTVHRTLWSCNTCLVASVDRNGGDQYLTFDSQADFAEHMDRVHHLPTSQLALGRAMDAFRRPVSVRDGQCSLCNGHANKLKNHLARHLEQIALFALPRLAPTTESGLSHRVLADPDGRGSGDRSGANSWESSLGTFHSGPGDNMGSDSLSVSGDQPESDNQNGDGHGSEAAVVGDSVYEEQQASPEVSVLTGYGAPLNHRDEHVIYIQNTVTREFKDLSLLETARAGNWVSVCEYAFAAIGSMAILLDISLNETLARFEVSSTKIMGKAGVVIGVLPHKLFHANLQYCVELGRSTFVQFQITTDLLWKTANNYIMDNGNMSNIIELLGNPDEADPDEADSDEADPDEADPDEADLDEAVLNLLYEIENVEKSAQRCLEEVERLCENFDFWCQVIGFLSDVAREFKGLEETREADGTKTKHAKEADGTKTKHDLNLAMGDLESLKSQAAIARHAATQKKEELGHTIQYLADVNQQLAGLNNTVSYLARFLNVILVELSTGVKLDMKDFPEAIRERVAEYRLEGINIGKVTKKRILAKTFSIQGRFSVIRDISKTFIEVLKKHIVPGLDKMRDLALFPDAEWDVKRGEFTAWCESSVAEIRALATEADANLGPNRQKRVLYLQQHALALMGDSFN